MKISGQQSRVFRIIMCQSVVLILACGFLFFSGTKPASAEATTCVCYGKAPDINTTQPKTLETIANSELECSQVCSNNGGYYIYSNSAIRQSIVLTHSTQSTKKEIADTLTDTLGLKAILTWLLLGILEFFGLLLSVAAAIFAWTADASSLSKVINGPLIYESWGVVRDLLNIAFILMLLYTAFTIIFQVDKTNKKIILTVVLMALLVNFSFPIARFVIDIGNSLMFTIFKNLLPTTDTIFSNFAEKSALADIIHPDNPSIYQLIASIVFVAILAITFLMIAMLFVLRIVALAIIIIFSPIGFVGVLFPSVSSKIDWWGNLFKYTFFGPAMAFMIYIATKIMATSINAQWGNNTFTKFGQDPSGGDLIQSMSTFAIPVIVLWIGMGVAQKMGIEGAAVAQKWATKATMWLPKAIGHATGVPGGLKKTKDYYSKKGAGALPGPLKHLGKIPGLRGEDKTKQTESWIASKLGVRGAMEQDMKTRAEEYKKNNETKASLINMAKNGDAAAAYRLALDGDITSDSYAGVMDKAKDKSVRDALDSKVKEKRIDIIVDYKIDKESAQRATQQNINIAQASQQIAEEEFGKINPSKWKDQNTKEAFGYDIVKYANTNGLSQDPKSIARRNAAQNVYNSYANSPKNQDKFVDDMNGEKYIAGVAAGIWP